MLAHGNGVDVGLLQAGRGRGTPSPATPAGRSPCPGGAPSLRGAYPAAGAARSFEEAEAARYPAVGVIGEAPTFGPPADIWRGIC